MHACSGCSGLWPTRQLKSSRESSAWQDVSRRSSRVGHWRWRFPPSRQRRAHSRARSRTPAARCCPASRSKCRAPCSSRAARPTSPTADGTYRITDLRPGTYTITFSLPGFKTARLEAVELRADFTGTLNANLEVGALEESITVTGASPVVDVSSNAKVEVLTARGARPGADRAQHPGLRAAGERRHAERPRRRRLARHAADLHVHARPHLGEQHRHGRRPDGERPRWRRRRAAVLQPGDGPGDELPDQRRRRRRLAGRRAHGHRRPGTAATSSTDRSSRPRPTGSWLANNLDDDLQARGLARRRAASTGSTTSTSASAARSSATSCGSSPRRAPVVGGRADCQHLLHARTACPTQPAIGQCRSGAVSCEQGIDDQSIESALLRLTWQMSPKHKFSVYYDEINKYRGHGMNAGDDPLTASQIWTSPRYNSAAAKYTGTLSNSCWSRPATRSTTRSTSSPTRTASTRRRSRPSGTPDASRRDAEPTRRSTSGLANWGGRYPDRFTCWARSRTSPARTTSRPASSTTGAPTSTRARPTPTCSRSTWQRRADT